MYDQILESLLTKEDLDSLRYELGLLENTNYKFGDKGLDQILNTELRYSTAKLIEEYLSQNDITTSEYIKGMLKEIELYEVIELTVAFEPTRTNMQNIKKWIRENLGEKFVIRYRYNPYLIAGAKVVSRGEYKNFSLEKLIDSFFEEHKETVSEIISQK